MLGLSIAGLVVLFAIAVVVFVNTAPQMGQKPKGQHLEHISQSPNWQDGSFVNLIETSMGSFGEMLSTLPDFIFGKNTSPKEPLPTRFSQDAEVVDSLCLVTWYGHSAFLIEMGGKRILIDPMLGESASPVGFMSSRFAYEEAIPLDKLTDIDALILSHDHYDHLDHKSIVALTPHVEHFYTALGVGSHLQHWGVPAEAITELDWWQESQQDDLRLVACPARHFSGRGLTDRNATQWASWVLELGEHKLYFSGDGGYGPHFKEIGAKEGSFDFAMLECGQYNKAWEAIHMLPEQSVQAGSDVGAALIMPIHWGAFNLSVHEWTEPIKRFKQAADDANMPMVHPYIGERFALGQDFPRAVWWE